MNSDEKWYLSGAVIVLALIFFWPAGLVLLYLRMSEKNQIYNFISYALLVVGIFLLILTFTMLCAFISYGEDFGVSLFCLALFGVPGAICTKIAAKRIKKIKEYEKYLRYVGVRSETPIDLLCSELGKDKSEVTRVLGEMVGNKVVSGYIRGEELFVREGMDSSAYTIDKSVYPRQTKIKVVVKCKECGAKNTLYAGEQKECEYCGTILQG